MPASGWALHLNESNTLSLPLSPSLPHSLTPSLPYSLSPRILPSRFNRFYHSLAQTPVISRCFLIPLIVLSDSRSLLIIAQLHPMPHPFRLYHAFHVHFDSFHSLDITARSFQMPWAFRFKNLYLSIYQPLSTCTFIYLFVCLSMTLPPHTRVCAFRSKNQTERERERECVCVCVCVCVCAKICTDAPMLIHICVHIDSVHIDTHRTCVCVCVCVRCGQPGKRVVHTHTRAHTQRCGRAWKMYR